MKNNLLRKIFISFLIKFICWIIIVPIVLFLGYIIIRQSDFQWIYNYSDNIYYNFINLFNSISNTSGFLILCIIFWMMGAVFLIYRLLKKVFYYINTISLASNDLMNKEIEYIELPPELEEIEKHMNHLKRESEKNERLAKENEQRKNDLIVYLAHDLKTPLTSMIGYLSLLDEIKDMPKKQQEKYIKIALNKSYRLEELINELFDITRFNSEKIILEKEDINLNMMLEQIIDDFYPMLQENNKEIKFHSDEAVTLNADSDKLARVFANLIKNAILYSTDKDIQIDVKKENDCIITVISNKGKNIPKEKLKRIFEKFYRVDSSRTTSTGGSGLGLAIAKEIVKLHGGDISATSDDEYTKFYVTLPIKNIKYK